MLIVLIIIILVFPNVVRQLKIRKINLKKKRFTKTERLYVPVHISSGFSSAHVVCGKASQRLHTIFPFGEFRASARAVASRVQDFRQRIRQHSRPHKRDLRYWILYREHSSRPDKIKDTGGWSAVQWANKNEPRNFSSFWWRVRRKNFRN